MSDSAAVDPQALLSASRRPTIEHILLDSGIREVPDLRTAQLNHARVRVRSRVRRRALQLDILDYYFLSVRCWRSGSMLTGYVLDLRFIDPRFELSRHVAWRWIVAALAFVASAVELVAHRGSIAQPWWQHNWPLLSFAVMTTGIVAAGVAVVKTTETVRVYSGLGRATVLEFSGGLGTLRALRIFMVKLVAHIQFAAGARRASRAGHLSDEMREHGRLKVLGVLSRREYEEAKARILGQHSYLRNQASQVHRLGDQRPSGRIPAKHRVQN